MSNYNLQIAWSGKDALADTDPDKVVSGDDFNTEFLAVQTAVNTKADLAGSSGQAFSASTPTAGNSSALVATTAFVTGAAYAPLASPTFTGVPKAPTASVATDTTQLATCEFVQDNKIAASASVLGLVKASLSGTTLTIATS
jgi:hypothetical protein|tara:strand:- start:201 stop:626 length:426 start_codon:yes stop_codon:yes gene_type:complete